MVLASADLKRHSWRTGKMADTETGATQPLTGKILVVGATRPLSGKTADMASGVIPRLAGKIPVVGATRPLTGKILVVGPIALAVANDYCYQSDTPQSNLRCVMTPIIMILFNQDLFYISEFLGALL